MSADEQRLRELLQAAAPDVEGVSPDVLATRPRRLRTPLAVVGAIVLVAALAIGATALFTRTDGRTQPGQTPDTGVPPNASTGEIRGTLLISPPMSAPYASSGSIVITGTTRFTITIGQSGHFTALVPPGDYTVIGHTPKFIVNGREGDCITQSGPTAVRAHQTVSVTVTCLEK